MSERDAGIKEDDLSKNEIVTPAVRLAAAYYEDVERHGKEAVDESLAGNGAKATSMQATAIELINRDGLPEEEVDRITAEILDFTDSNREQV